MAIINVAVNTNWKLMCTKIECKVWNSFCIYRVYVSAQLLVHTPGSKSVVIWSKVHEEAKGVVSSLYNCKDMQEPGSEIYVSSDI